MISDQLLLARAHHRQGRFAEADILCRKILASEPNNSDALHLMGTIAYETGRYQIAVAMIGKAVSINEFNPSFHNSLSTIYRETWRLDDAVVSSRRALAMDPTFADAYYNLGSALYRQGRIVEAMDHLRCAIKYQPDHARAHDRLGCAYLMNGEFDVGWLEYEWRWRNKGFERASSRFVQSQWYGEPLNGARILLHAEQGFGDTLQFVRYAPLVGACGGHVVLEVQPELHRLLKNMPNVDEVIARGDARPDFSWHCPLLSLPLAMGTRLENIPAKVPYINSDYAAGKTTERKSKKEPLRVGLNWAGNPRHKWDQVRSLPYLSLLGLLTSIDNVTLFSLQMGGAAEQVKHPPAGMKIVDLGSYQTDFSDTAANIRMLDLVITVDTSVAHLAGALGKPVWILLANVADWIWLKERGDSPWYPTARLFRQPALGDWVSVVERVVEELRRLADGDRRALVPD